MQWNDNLMSRRVVLSLWRFTRYARCHMRPCRSRLVHIEVIKEKSLSWKNLLTGLKHQIPTPREICPPPVCLNIDVTQIKGWAHNSLISLCLDNLLHTQYYHTIVSACWVIQSYYQDTFKQFPVHPNTFRYSVLLRLGSIIVSDLTKVDMACTVTAIWNPSISRVSAPCFYPSRQLKEVEWRPLKISNVSRSYYLWVPVRWVVLL